MTELVIDNLDDDLRNQLEVLARVHGQSIVEEVRDILRQAVAAPPTDDANENLGARLARRFAGLGLDHEIPELRFGPVSPPSFDP